MSDFVVQLDPPAVATNRTMLDLNTGPICIGGPAGGATGIDWGQAAITAYETQQGQYGNSPSDFVIPNRTVTIQMLLGADDSGTEEQARSQLQQKVALLQREGGHILRQRNGGPAMYADIVNATLGIPDIFGATGGVEPNVQLILECLPDFYGDEITLDSVTATGHSEAVLKQSGTQAIIEGDYPARCRVVITDTSGNDQKSLLWGVRSRHYASGAVNALVYEAEALTPIDGAAVATLSGASGAQVITQSLSGGIWTPVLSTNLLGGAQLTHQGSYAVWARCHSATAVPYLRLAWGVADIAHPVYNDRVQLPAAGGFYLVNLGPIRLDVPPSASSLAWTGVIQAISGANGDDISIDCLYLQPLDEAAGRLIAVQSPSTIGSTATNNPTTYADNAAVGSVAWSSPDFATVKDGTSALAALTSPSNTQSHYLELTGYGFTIPNAATIAGISVTVTRSSRFGHITDANLRLVKAGTVQTTDRADTATPWPAGSNVDRTYGGSTDLWGSAWTPSDINNSGFGVVLSAAVVPGGSWNDNAAVDCITITVAYATTGGFVQVQDAVVYANQAAEARSEGAYRKTSTGASWGVVALELGDLTRIPPSGMENRAAQLLVKPSRGDLASIADAGLDAFTAQVIYRPCWLSRP